MTAYLLALLLGVAFLAVLLLIAWVATWLVNALAYCIASALGLDWLGTDRTKEGS